MGECLPLYMIVDNIILKVQSLDFSHNLIARSGDRIYTDNLPASSTVFQLRMKKSQKGEIRLAVWP